MTLADLPNESRGQIKDLAGDPTLVARLRELGFIRGEEVRIAGRAPFGEPILIEIRGSTVALRTREAQCVQM
jgi:ferrous iron transport protein A